MMNQVSTILLVADYHHQNFTAVDRDLGAAKNDFSPPISFTSSSFLLLIRFKTYDLTLTYFRLIFNSMEDWFIYTAGGIDMMVPLERARPLFLRDNYQEFR